MTVTATGLSPEEGQHGRAGGVDVELRGHSAHSLAAELAPFGGAIEVFTPDAVRQRMAEIGGELVDRYGAPPALSEPSARPRR